MPAVTSWLPVSLLLGVLLMAASSAVAGDATLRLRVVALQCP